MARSRKVMLRLAAAIGLLVWGGIGLSGGCGSSALPPRLTAAERAFVQSTRLPLSVAVEKYERPVYSERLLVKLQQVQIFARVDHAERFDTTPDLLARVERGIHGTAVVPIFTALSLGLIPTVVTEEHGHTFSLRRPDEREGVRVTFSYEGATVLGWFAVPLNALPNRTMGDPQAHPRFLEGFAWAIASRRDRIAALATTRP